MGRKAKTSLNTFTPTNTLNEANAILTYEGANYLRQRLVLSILTGRPVAIENVRMHSDEPGLCDYEVAFVRLLEQLTNGTHCDINKTGTKMMFSPGLLHGGKVQFECPSERCISYYIEPLLCLAPFCKFPLDVWLTGVTNNKIEPSVDTLKLAWIPFIRRCLLNDEHMSIEIVSRGYPPEAGGKVHVKMPICKTLRPVKCAPTLPKVRRIRGQAHGAKVSPTILHRMIAGAKDALRDYISDVYITTDHRKGASGGNSPGFGLVLRADTTDENCVFVGEAMSNPRRVRSGDEGEEGLDDTEKEEPSVAEDVGRKAAVALLDEIYRGGCIDSTCQSLASLYMTFGQADVSILIAGPLSNYTIEMLRHIKAFVNVKFQLTNFDIPDAPKEKKGEKGELQFEGEEDDSDEEEEVG